MKIIRRLNDELQALYKLNIRMLELKRNFDGRGMYVGNPAWVGSKEQKKILLRISELEDMIRRRRTKKFEVTK